jgi:hypothetical protein
MQQTTENPRYERLLNERITLGRLYVDDVSHGAPFGDATRLFAQIQRLDRQLDRFRRYRWDENRLVATAEDERWHVPGEPPSSNPECNLCVKHQLHLPRTLVLPISPPAARRQPVEGAA